MESKAKFLGHSVHQMLIVFPLGLLATAVAFDLAWWASELPVMAAVSYWMLAAGLLGAVVAAPFGFIDWLAIPRGTRARRIGALHGIGNVFVTLLFLASWMMRESADVEPSAFATGLAIVGACIALVTAWLGGELVGRLGVGVYDDANLDAPNSLDAPSRQQRAHGH